MILTCTILRPRAPKGLIRRWGLIIRKQPEDGGPFDGDLLEGGLNLVFTVLKKGQMYKRLERNFSID